jgi:hypothetical protein
VTDDMSVNTVYAYSIIRLNLDLHDIARK